MAYSTQEIQNWINTNTAGMTDAQRKEAIYNAAQQYGISAEQLAPAVGYTVSDINRYTTDTFGGTLNSAAPAPVAAPAVDAGLPYSDAEVAQYIQKIQGMGLSPLEQERAIYEAAQQYGVGLDQVGRIMGIHQADIDQWVKQQYPTPESPQDMLLQAQQMTQQAAGYTPQQVTGQGYTPQTIGQTDLSQYMNPYTQQVIDQSLADLERQRQMQTNNLGFSATQAGAFGGSRHGVAEALTNEGFARQGGQLAAGLRQQGFGQALQTAGQDVASQNQALGFGASAQNAAQLANQSAGLQGNQQLLSAANQMANLNNLGFTQQNALNQQMFAQGTAEQQMMQTLFNNALNQYSGWSGAGTAGLGLVPGATGVFGNMGTTSQGYSPGLTDYLGLGLYGYSLMPK